LGGCRHDELDGGGYMLHVVAREWGEEEECGGCSGGEHEEGGRCGNRDRL